MINKPIILHPILINKSIKMKKLFVFAIVALAFTACNNSAKPEGTTTGDTAVITSETPAVTPEVTPAPTETPVPTETPASTPAK